MTTTPTASTHDRHLHYRAEHGSYYLYAGPNLVRMVDHLKDVAFAYDTASGRIVHHGTREAAKTYADRANAIFTGSWTIGVVSFEDGFPIDEINAALKSGSVWDIVKARPALAGALSVEEYGKPLDPEKHTIHLTREEFHKLSLEGFRMAHRIVVDGVPVKDRWGEVPPDGVRLLAGHPLLRPDKADFHSNDGA